MKCNERVLHDEELRTLRKQVDSSQNYRTVIAKQEAEIVVRLKKFIEKKIRTFLVFFLQKLREQLANENKLDFI